MSRLSRSDGMQRVCVRERERQSKRVLKNSSHVPSVIVSRTMA